jgi:hypothetical protein
VTHDNTHGPPSPPSDGLVNLLRRIADHDDVPNTTHADARNYLHSLEAAAFGSSPVRGEARMIGDLPNDREVVKGTAAASARDWLTRRVPQ